MSTVQHSKREGFLGSLTDEQQQALSELQNTLSQPGDDVWLLRFLRYHDFDVSTARVPYERMMAWRRETGCDQLLQEWDMTECFASEADMKAFRSYHQQGYHHTDREGRPLLIDRCGLADVKGLRTVISEDNHIKARIYAWEQLLQIMFPACCDRFGGRIETTSVLLDLRGLSMTDVWDKENMNFLKRTIALDRDYYPEMLHKMYILHAPWAFRGAWSVIKTFLPTPMVEKIKILGDNYREILMEDIDMDLLPTWLGL